MNEHSHEDFITAFQMLEKESEPLKFEVFYSYTLMVANGALKEFKPQDVMLHAMMEWDLA
jgi:hypothetical protein